MADKSRKGLGKGLDSIFGTNVEQFLDDIQNNGKEVPGRREIEIAIDEIRANPYQPRKEFDEKTLQDLSNSIKVHGIFTPLLVRKSQAKGYELIAGERRLRAAKLAGLTVVPAISVEFTDEEMMEISILENVQREDLNPIEEAAAYDSLIKRLGYTQEKLAERVGKSREYCANMLRLLKLPQDVQQLVSEKKLTMGHVRPLLSLKDEDEMYDVAIHIMKEKMSVRDVEKYIRELNGQDNKKKKDKVEKDPVVLDLEHRLSEKLATQVEIGKNKMTITFHDTKDLNRILEILDCLDKGI